MRYKLGRTIEHFATVRNDAVAIGLLSRLKRSGFVQVLYLLSNVLPTLTRLSKNFQSRTFNFSSATEHIEEAKRELQTKLASGVVAGKVRLEWERFSSDLGEWKNLYAEQLDQLSSDYLQSLLSSIDDRFPDHRILSAFGIFNPALIPEDPEMRKLHGGHQLNILIDQFSGVLQLDGMSPRKLKVDWPSFLERIYAKRNQLDTAAKVCSYVIRDVHFKEIFPEISRLATIALSCPLTTADPERGFVVFNDVKSKKRNRLLDETTSALLKVSINGSKCLTSDALSSIADKWKTVKQLRHVVHRGVENLGKYDEMKMQKQKAQEAEKQQTAVEDLDNLSNADLNSLVDLSDRFLFD